MGGSSPGEYGSTATLEATAEAAASGSTESEGEVVVETTELNAVPRSSEVRKNSNCFCRTLEGGAPM